MRWAARFAFAFASLGSAACSFAGYGSAFDASRFVSVRQNERGQVLYSVQGLIYRPATGWRAFPDGGIPRYTTDRNLIGLLAPATGKVEVLQVRPNRDWQHGQGQLTIHSFIDTTAVIVESGQRRTDYVSDVRYYLVDVAAKRFTPLSLKKDLAARRRNVGYFYLLDARGTLLFVTPPLGASRVEATTDEIWLRKPPDQYALVAKAADLYQHSSRELVYWEIDTRQLWAYDVVTGTRQARARYVPAQEPSAEWDVRISIDGKALERWRRDGDGWSRERSVLALDGAR